MSAVNVVGGRGDAGDPSTAPTAAGGDGLRVLTLRPRRSLLVELALPVIALAVPVTVVLMWLAPPAVTAPVGGALIVLFCFVLPLAVLTFRRTHVSVSRFGLVERGILGVTRAIPAADVVEVVRLDLYRSTSLDTTAQLFAIGADGRCLLRLRGGFWDDDTLASVAEILGVPETVAAEPVTMTELQRERPEWLDWFERCPILGRITASAL